MEKTEIEIFLINQTINQKTVGESKQNKISSWADDERLD